MAALTRLRVCGYLRVRGALGFYSSPIHYKSNPEGSLVDIHSDLDVENTEASTSTISQLSDEKLVEQIKIGSLKDFKLESELNNPVRAASVRRAFTVSMIREETKRPQFEVSAIPQDGINAFEFYNSVYGTNCESVIGFVPVPLGVVGPLVLDGQTLRVPMATTEGALIASANRGMRAIALSGGARSMVLKNGMSRSPVVKLPDVVSAARLHAWVNDPNNFSTLTEAFSSTTRFGKLLSVRATLAGRNVFLRFVAHSGDAMGMNMVTKGVAQCMNRLQQEFTDMEMVSISGNYCSDKKPAAINWIEGRGKSVVCEALLSGKVLRETLKTSAAALSELNQVKNLVGSALAGSIGGFNAHSSNIVSAVYLATGQDPAQNIESSNCITLMERVGEEDLHVSCTMPSIEVGTIGGGTSLPAQAACLDMLGVKGSNQEEPGKNAEQLAKVVCASVLAGEISLMSALSSGHLMTAHLKLNRKKH